MCGVQLAQVDMMAECTFCGLMKPAKYMSPYYGDLYHLFAEPAILTCTDYGVKAHYFGRNDVLVGDRKIYGSAQLSWYSAFVQSGTFLVNINLEVMARALTPPELKFAGKSVRSIQDRVTSHSREVGRELDTHMVMNRFTDHFADVLGVRLVHGDLTSVEKTLASELLAVTYSRDEWNLGTRTEFQVMVTDKSVEGVLSLSANMEDRIIKKVRITGDLLLSDRRELETLEHSLTNCSLQEVQTVVQAARLSANIRDTSLRLLTKLAREVDVVASKTKESRS